MRLHVYIMCICVVNFVVCNMYPRFVIELSLEVVQSELELLSSLGKSGVGTVQFLVGVLKVEVLLGETGLQCVSVIQLPVGKNIKQ